MASNEDKVAQFARDCINQLEECYVRIIQGKTRNGASTVQSGIVVGSDSGDLTRILLDAIGQLDGADGRVWLHCVVKGTSDVAATLAGLTLEASSMEADVSNDRAAANEAVKALVDGFRILSSDAHDARSQARETITRTIELAKDRDTAMLELAKQVSANTGMEQIAMQALTMALPLLMRKRIAKTETVTKEGDEATTAVEEVAPIDEAISVILAEVERDPKLVTAERLERLMPLLARAMEVLS